jgi:NifU-like protein involved in Fe-S cluster formation
MSGAARLYTPELLALTLRLALCPWRDGMALAGSARSRSCGSTLKIGLSLDPHGRVDDLAMQVHACAVGQAAAALFADAVRGLTIGQIRAAHRAVSLWVTGQGPLPDWPGLALIDPARAYPARHGAMMLPWEAALAALSSAAPSD